MRNVEKLRGLRGEALTILRRKIAVGTCALHPRERGLLLVDAPYADNGAMSRLVQQVGEYINARLHTRQDGHFVSRITIRPFPGVLAELDLERDDAPVMADEALGSRAAWPAYPVSRPTRLDTTDDMRRSLHTEHAIKRARNRR